MNQVSKIHLARTTYDIDTEAQKTLEKYLAAIKKSLGDEADAMEDIEIRMVEILSQRGVNKDDVITETDVAAVKEQLGESNDFSSDTDHRKTKNHSHSENPSSHSNFTAQKKYYRDTDNAVLGGVVAGLSAYTGWDVTLLRILLVVLTFFSFGFFVILYIVVWICAPEAKTTSEKLEMHGQPVNIDSIKESVKNFGEKAEAAGKNVSNQASKVAKEVSAKAPSISNALGRAIMIITGLIGICIIIPFTIALVAGSNYLLYSVANMDVVAKSLLIVTISLAIAAAIMLIALGCAIILGLLIGNFSKALKTSIATFFILSIALVIAAAGTGSAWFSISGNQNTREVIKQIHDNSRSFRHHN